MAEVAIAKLFRNGRSQAVRLPQFRFEGDRVRIQRVGEVCFSSRSNSIWRHGSRRSIACGRSRSWQTAGISLYRRNAMFE